MRKLCVVLGALLCPGTEVAADAPFSWRPVAADHVVTMVVKHAYSAKISERIVTHHAGWSRIDRIEEHARSSSYFGHGGATGVYFVRGASGEYAHLSISRGPEQYGTLGGDYRSFRTGERQVFLGESCHIWDVLRTHESVRIVNNDYARFSCVTDDGIELWYKVTSNGRVVSSAEATRVERRTVQPNEVHPPADLLVLKSWVDPIEPSTPSGGAGNYETVMKAARADIGETWTFTRTTRRRAPWTYTEDGGAGRDGWRTLSIENEASRVHIRFERNESGEFKQLTISKSPPRAADGSDLQVGMLVEDGRRETILGEECAWFDMMPGVMDAGLAQCKTHDGIVLKEAQTSRGSNKMLEAVRLRRRAVGLAEVLPPSGFLTRKNWGLPD